MIFINVSISELKNILQNKNINLIDIRSSYKYSLGTIKNAKNISTENLLSNYSKYLKKDEEYYIFCDSGSNSMMVCNMLSRMGYKVYNINGGYKKYLLEK